MPALIKCFNDESRDVRCGALKVLEKLDPTTLAKYALAFVEFLDDEYNHVREVQPAKKQGDLQPVKTAGGDRAIFSLMK